MCTVVHIGGHGNIRWAAWILHALGVPPTALLARAGTGALKHHLG